MKALLVLGLVGWMGVAHAEINHPSDNFMTTEEIIRRLQPYNSSFSTATPAERRGTKDADDRRQKRLVKGEGT